MNRKKEWPQVSILIASKDRRSDLERALETVRALDYPKELIEVVVVEETDQPQPIDGIEYYSIPRKNLGFGYARNQCVQRATYSLLAFTDDDCLLHPDWLKELVLGLDEGIGGVAGAVEVKERKGIGFCESILGFPGGGLKSSWRAEGKVIPISQLSTCNALFQKKVFEKVGFFQENTLFSGEDYDFAQRVVRQFQCVYNPNAIVYHRPRGSFKHIFSWFVRRGQCEINMLFLKTHSTAWQLYYIFSTSFLLRLFIMGIVLSFLKVPFVLTVALYFLIYITLNLIRTQFQFELGGTLKTWLLLPLVKLFMDLGWDCGKFLGLISLFSNKRESK